MGRNRSLPGSRPRRGKPARLLIALCAMGLFALASATPVGALFLGEWGGAGAGDGEFNNPTSLATDGSNFVYVADTANNRIQKFTELGEFVTKWGGPGTGPGQLQAPTGIAVDLNGNVFVADTGSNRIVKYDPTGNAVASWGNAGIASGQFNAPTGVATDPAGNVYVADS